MAPEKLKRIAIFISDKVNFKPKSVRNNKNGDFILIKGVIQQEEITMINIYMPNVVSPNFIKHTLKITNRPQHSGSGRL
jgi:hypothetical protein